MDQGLAQVGLRVFRQQDRRPSQAVEARARQERAPEHRGRLRPIRRGQVAAERLGVGSRGDRTRRSRAIRHWPAEQPRSHQDRPQEPHARPSKTPQVSQVGKRSDVATDEGRSAWIEFPRRRRMRGASTERAPSPRQSARISIPNCCARWTAARRDPDSRRRVERHHACRGRRCRSLARQAEGSSRRSPWRPAASTRRGKARRPPASCDTQADWTAGPIASASGPRAGPSTNSTVD